jgi:hypothetical protein
LGDNLLRCLEAVVGFLELFIIFGGKFEGNGEIVLTVFVIDAIGMALSGEREGGNGNLQGGCCFHGGICSLGGLLGVGLLQVI